MSFKNFTLFSIFVISLSSIACGPNEAILKSNSNETSSTPSAVSNSRPAYDSVESEVENMRTADFEIILVLRRKDGEVMQQDDKTFVRTTITNANRRSLVDGDKAIVIGANSKISPDLIKKLNDRFAVQDFSKPAAENSNSNSPANANIVR
jgi:hypothetical protein